MTEELAISMAHDRMRDMGFTKKDYALTVRHFVLKVSETRDINAFNEYYFLSHDPVDVTVLSDFGFYDLSFERTNELKYEHQGFISLKNNAGTVNHIRFIHVVLNNNK
jgi:hypothetical protein